MVGVKRSEKVCARAALGIEPRTSRTLSENHTTRPSSRLPKFFVCSSTDKNRSNEASLSPRAVLTDDTATVLLSSPRWEARVGAAEVCKVHSAGTGTSHKVSSLQIHDRTQTRQTQLTCSDTVVGFET